MINDPDSLRTMFIIRTTFNCNLGVIPQNDALHLKETLCVKMRRPYMLHLH